MSKGFSPADEWVTIVGRVKDCRCCAKEPISFVGWFLAIFGCVLFYVKGVVLGRKLIIEKTERDNVVESKTEAKGLREGC